jgi:hypothetical protein
LTAAAKRAAPPAVDGPTRVHDIDPSEFAPACVVRRNCVTAYRDATRYVSCKIEHFAETPDRRRYLHLNFLATFGGEDIVLKLSASVGDPPEIGKAGTSIACVALEFQGSEGEFSTKDWAQCVAGDYAIRHRPLTDDNLDDLERCIAYMIKAPYFASVETGDGAIEKFLVYDPKPDSAVASKFRAAFDALRREHPSGPAGLPYGLAERSRPHEQYDQSGISRLAQLLGCDPPDAPDVGGRTKRVVWSRAYAFAGKVEDRTENLGLGDLETSLIASTNVGPETLHMTTALEVAESHFDLRLVTLRGLDPKHIRPDDDVSPVVSAWHYGSHGRFDTRNWDQIVDEGISVRRRRFTEISQDAFDVALAHATCLPHLVVLNTEDGTQWRCLVLHDEPRPLIAGELRMRLEEIAPRRPA